MAFGIWCPSGLRTLEPSEPCAEYCRPFEMFYDLLVPFINSQNNSEYSRYASEHFRNISIISGQPLKPLSLFIFICIHTLNVSKP
jgi:hypothetical protein